MASSKIEPGLGAVAAGSVEWSPPAVRTNPTLDPPGTKIVSFSIPSCAFAGLGGVEKVLRSVEGVEIVRRRRFLQLPTDIHFEFRFRGVDCVVWEPWGDSSEYVVAQSDDTEPVDLSPIESAFRDRGLWGLRRRVSDSGPVVD